MATTTSGDRAIIYDRVSEADPESQAEHLRRCRDFAAARGWTVVEEVTETVSGFRRDAKRPGWAKVVGLVEADAVDAVVVFSTSRAGRNLATFAGFIEKCRDHGVTFASATEPIDSAGPWGGVFSAILGALAEMESLYKRERALVGRASAKREGRWTGGRRPFGWRVADGRLVVDKGEAKIIRKAVTDVLNGVGLRTIANRWNDDGIRTTAGNPWKAATVRTTLTGAYNVPEVITDSDRRALLKMFKSRSKTRAPERYTLSGLVYCAEDGAHLNGRAGAYVCTHGGDKGRSLHLSINAAALDLHVANAVVVREREHPVELRAAWDVTDELVQERERILNEQRELGRSKLPLAVIEGRAERLADELAEVDAKLDTGKPAPSTSGGFWERYLSEQDASLHRLVERIEVGPSSRRGPGFDEDRVRIVWR